MRTSTLKAHELVGQMFEDELDLAYVVMSGVEAGQNAPVGSAIALIAEAEAEIEKVQKLRSSRK